MGEGNRKKQNKKNNGEVTEARRKRERRHSLRRHSPPVSVDAVLEVQHSQPPHVHVQHVVIDDVLRDKKNHGRGQGGAGSKTSVLTNHKHRNKLKDD